MDDFDDIIARIDTALARKGLSDAAASKMAVGNYSLIKNLRSSRASSPEDRRTNFHALQKLAAVLDLECYFGPPREVGPIEQVVVDGSDYAHVPLHDALLAAGSGRNNSSEGVIDNLAFRRDWLKKIGISASAARLARVQGDSMQPSLWDGDVVLIDTRSNTPIVRSVEGRDQRRSPIYALLDSGEARVKRVQRLSEKAFLLLSDNPDYPPELRQDRDLLDIKIIGRVVWWGHTNRE